MKDLVCSGLNHVKFFNLQLFLAGNSELLIRQGLTSNNPLVEIVRSPLSQITSLKEKEHVVPISQGFYISFRGYFKANSHLAIAYAAFNYRGIIKT